MKSRLFTLLFLAGLQPLVAQFCFQPRVAYPVGTNPSSLCHADFNGDSITDLAVANRAGTVSVLLGKGAGVFDTSTYFQVGYLPYSITAADFNNDSLTDLATANLGPWDVSVIFGNGAGGFSTDTSAFGVSSPKAMVTADFNRDGNADLAVTHYGLVEVALGNGAGGFAAPLSVAVGSPVSALTTADFNGDTIPDLAAVGASSVAILLGNGLGGFGGVNSFAIDTSPLSIISVDLNHDSKADLVTCNMNNNITGNISVLLGTGSFATVTNYSINSSVVPRALCSADFDGDGNVDLALAVVRGNTVPFVSLIPGDGLGGFGAPTLLDVDSFPNSIISTDFNKDGKPDLAVVSVYSNINTGFVDVLLNCSTTTAIPDAGFNNSDLLVYPNPTNGKFRVNYSDNSGHYVQSIAVYNLLGETVNGMNETRSASYTDIDLSQVSRGIYFVKVQLADKTYTQKICKE